MNRRYSEVMDRIEVTDEMRGRILKNIQNMSTEALPGRKVIPFPGFKKYLSAAACLVLLLAGAVTLPRLMHRQTPEPPPVQVIPQIVEAASSRELSDLVGFEVEETFMLPFNAEKISYTAYWSELAQVTYSGEGQSAVFRKSVGTEDNSGDYTAYTASAQLPANGWTVVLSGDGEIYSLAVWTDGEFSCSLRLSQGISREAWRAVFGI